jgi:uncharacterized protein
MQFNVSQLLREPSGSARAYEIDESVALGREGEVQQLGGAVKLLRTDRAVWVTAVLDSEALCACSRCLDDYRQSVRMEIEEEFYPQDESKAAGGPARVDLLDEICRIDNDNILDLTEVIKQYYTLSLPMKPVCRSDCKGLCATCGANLNGFICGCDTSPRDSRWSPLLATVRSVEQIESNR